MKFEEAWSAMSKKNSAIKAEYVRIKPKDLMRMCKAFYETGEDEGRKRGDIDLLSRMMGMKK